MRTCPSSSWASAEGACLWWQLWLACGPLWPPPSGATSTEQGEASSSVGASFFARPGGCLSGYGTLYCFESICCLACLKLYLEGIHHNIKGSGHGSRAPLHARRYDGAKMWVVLLLWPLLALLSDSFRRELRAALSRQGTPPSKVGGCIRGCWPGCSECHVRMSARACYNTMSLACCAAGSIDNLILLGVQGAER